MKLDDRQLRALTLVGQVGLTMVVSILLGLFVGLWLDRRLGTAPIAALSCMFLGIAAGAVSLYRAVSWFVAAMEKRPGEGGKGESPPVE